MYNPKNAEYNIIDGPSGNYFAWLDNDTFLTSGDSGNQTKLDVVQYSTDDLTNPESLDFMSKFWLDVSLSNSKVVFINDGVNIFDRTSGQRQNILNYHEWDPMNPKWLSNGRILFIDGQTEGLYIVDPDGQVFKL